MLSSFSSRRIEEANLKIKLENGTKAEVQEYRAFWCKKLCYIWDTDRCEFSKLTGLDRHIYCSELNSNKNDGLTREKQFLQYNTYFINGGKSWLNAATMIFYAPFFIYL